MDAGVAYREQAAHGESKVRIVVMLYEQMVRDLVRAEAAIEQGHVEARTAALNHVLEVLGQLQGRLDFERGGEVAHNLAAFYNQVRQRVQDAHAQASTQILREQISLLLMLRDAWVEVDRQTQPVEVAKPEPAKNGGSDTSGAVTQDWRV